MFLFLYFNTSIRQTPPVSVNKIHSNKNGSLKCHFALQLPLTPVKQGYFSDVSIDNNSCIVNTKIIHTRQLFIITFVL